MQIYYGLFLFFELLTFITLISLKVEQKKRDKEINKIVPHKNLKTYLNRKHDLLFGI